MISNYFKIALRSIVKERTFTLINISGLTVAFATAILLSIYSIFELSFDSFHNSDNIFQIYSTYKIPGGDQVNTTQPIPFARALKEEVPGVKNIARYNSRSQVIISEGKQFSFSVAFTDPEFFSLFNFPIIEGNKRLFLQPSDIAITEETAKNLYGEEKVIGETLSIQIDGEEKVFTITSVLKDIPENSSLSFDIAADFTQQSRSSYADLKDDWGHSNHEVYLELEPGISASTFEKTTQKFSNFHNQGFITQMKREGVKPYEDGQFIQERLLPLEDFHLAKQKEGRLQADRLFPILLLGIVILVLFIASVNFVNMSIAKNFQRIREIGMRKTLGANKTQLFFQFWGESLLIYIFSSLLGILVGWLLLKEFQSLFRTTASFDLLVNPVGIGALLLMVILVSLIAGGYPAISAGRINTISAIKGKLNTKGQNKLRDTLIVFQFSIAILLISGTIVLHSQLDYLRNKDLGFKKEEVISFPLNGKRNDQQVIQLLRNKLRKNPDVVNVSAANNILGLGLDGGRSTHGMGFEFEGRTIHTNLLMVENDYSETLGLEIKKGRSFESSRPADSLSIIINESMAHQLNLEEVIGRPVIMDDKQFTIIGVVEDYNFENLDKPIRPLTLFFKPNWDMRYAYIRVKNANSSQILKTIENIWKEIEPEAEFQGSYLNENIERILKREKNLIAMITSGSVIAIILSCMGLFAMSLIVASQRKKEVGIRKVAGARAGTISLLLAKDFVKLVLLAFLISTPVAWFLSNQWLQNYPYRVDLTIWMFLAAGIIALAIAITTISFKTLQAAVQNPIKSLRSE